MSDETSSLSYQISEKGALIVVSFAGALSKSALATLEECKSTLLSKSPSCVVFNLQGLTQMDFPGMASFIQLKKVLRDSSTTLKICALDPNLADLLDQKGALRRNELVADLKSALLSCQEFVKA